jgi:PadR family transcriptional regulator, regulatory protein PadR
MSANKELMKGSTATLVLTILAKGEHYGYEIIKEIEKCSEGLFELREGTLYPILHGLEADGFVSSHWVGKEGTRQRKYYSITKSGRGLLKEKKEEWARFRSAVDRIVFTRTTYQEGL